MKGSRVQVAPEALSIIKVRNMGNKLTDSEGRVKVFGFRSGKSWKMIIAVLYYTVAAFVFVTSVINEFRYYSFEAIDVVLVIIKYIFIFVDSLCAHTSKNARVANGKQITNIL